jgi:Fungal N-terminal domain of STAND proteins
MDPFTILGATGTAVGLAKNISSTLSSIISQTSNVDRSFKQLHREVSDFQLVLQQLEHDFSNPQVKAAAFERQTGHLGAHWKAVLSFVAECNQRLDELDKLVKGMAGTTSFTQSKPVKAWRLDYASGDVQYYRDEIRDYKSNISIILQMIAVSVSQSNIWHLWG